MTITRNTSFQLLLPKKWLTKNFFQNWIYIDSKIWFKRIESRDECMLVSTWYGKRNMLHDENHCVKLLKIASHNIRCDAMRCSHIPQMLYHSLLYSYFCSLLCFLQFQLFKLLFLNPLLFSGPVLWHCEFQYCGFLQSASIL